MRFTSERHLDDGVLERAFTLGDIPGFLWTPAFATAQVPLILLGHPPLGLGRMYPRLVRGPGAPQRMVSPPPRSTARQR